MFGWFAPKCPLQTWEKAWTETRMRWLADTLGIDRLLQARLVLANDEFFPDTYEATPEGARRLMERVARYMHVDPGPIRLEVCTDHQLPGAAGHYDASDGTTIRVADSLLGQPERLVATLAHELAHQILLGGGLLDQTVPDHEWVTDLLPAFLGLGVFAANSVVHEQSGQTGRYGWWVIGKHGYLPARIYGYAFALAAFVRGEDGSAWAAHLRLDAADPLRQGLRYLQKTGDTLFHPDTARHRYQPLAVSGLIDRLQNGSASARMAALWEVRERGPAAVEAVSAVSDLLTDADEEIPGEAALTLGAMGPDARAAIPQLREALGHRVAGARAGAAQALGQLATDSDVPAPELAILLRDTEPDVVTAAVGALSSYGHRAESTTPKLLDALTAALVNCDDAAVVQLVQTIRAVTADPGQAVRQHAGTRDPELQRMLFEALRAD
jgi:hypothetical protein